MDQPISSAPPNSSSSTYQIVRHTPAARQSRGRRQHVMSQPISRGGYSHGMPVLSTKRMPVRQARLGMRVRRRTRVASAENVVGSVPIIHPIPAVWPCSCPPWQGLWAMKFVGQTKQRSVGFVRAPKRPYGI
jgi:hypothetical protein